MVHPTRVWLCQHLEHVFFSLVCDHLAPVCKSLPKGNDPELRHNFSGRKSGMSRLCVVLIGSSRTVTHISATS